METNLKQQLKQAQEDVKNIDILVKIDASREKLKSLSIADLIALYQYACKKRDHYKLIYPKDITIRYEVMAEIIDKFIYEYMAENLPEL